MLNIIKRFLICTANFARLYLFSICLVINYSIPLHSTSCSKSRNAIVKMKNIDNIKYDSNTGSSSSEN